VSTEVTLGDVAQWGSGGTPKRSIPEYFGDGTPWLSIADLNDGIVTSAKESLTAAGIANSAAKIVPPGTLLVAMYGSIGKLGITATEMTTSQAIAFAKPLEDLVDRRYLFHYLLAQRPKLQALGRGGTQMNIGQADLKAWPIPLPPLPEQRRIATILDHADSLRTKRRQVLTHLDSLARSVFHEMFGDPDRAMDNITLGSIADLAGGRNLVADDSTFDSPYRVLKISAVTSGQFKPNESKPLPVDYVPPTDHLVRPGDLLMSRANTTELVGAVAYVSSTPENLALPDKVWRFEWKISADPVFYNALLSTDTIRRRISRLSSGTGGSMKNVSKAKLATMPVPRIDLSLQRDFADRIGLISTKRNLHDLACNADDELFTSLQDRAFGGDL